MRVVTIDGLVIYIYADDHLPPHVHAIHGSFKEVVNIKTCKIIEGKLPPKEGKRAINYVKKTNIYHKLNHCISSTKLQ